MGNNQYYLDDDWYQDIKLDASIPISSGEDLISSSSFHTANSNKDKSSQPFNNPSLTSSQNQNNGNIISNPKCLHDENNDLNEDALSRSAGQEKSAEHENETRPK